MAKKLTARLSDAQVEYVERLVSQGRFRNKSAVIRAAVIAMQKKPEKPEPKKPLVVIRKVTISQ